MRLSILLGASAIFFVGLSQSRSVAADDAAPTKSLRVLLTIGGHPFEQKPFYAMWDALPGITYSKCQLPQQADMLKPGLEKQYDAIVMYDMSKGFTPQQEQAFVELLKTGIGLVALHHNLCSHMDWPKYRQIIGGRYFQQPETIDGREYAKSNYLHDQHFEVKVADPDHPITRGIGNFHMDDEAYSGFYVAPDSHVLLTVNHAKCDHDVCWTTHFGNSRVFYLMFGHGPSAWQNPVYPKLLERGIRWVAQKQ